jgi:ABC-type sulfate transport system substrate-binding protein
MNFVAICPNISFTDNEDLPLMTLYNFYQDDGIKSVDISDYTLNGTILNCQVVSVTWQSRRLLFLNKAKFPTKNLTEAMTDDYELKMFSHKGTKVMIDTSKGSVGEQSALLMFKQKAGNVAFLEFVVELEKKPVVSPKFTIPIVEEEAPVEEEVVEEEVVVPEPVV